MWADVFASAVFQIRLLVVGHRRERVKLSQVAAMKMGRGKKALLWFAVVTFAAVFVNGTLSCCMN